jgi:hypothetical protein
MIAADAVQTTAASQPLLLAHNGASSDNYFYAGPGSDVAGAVCQTNTNVSPQINTDFTFEFNFKDFISRGILGGCPTGSSDGWSLQIQGATNVLRFYVRNTSVNVSIESTVGINVTGNRWIKVIKSGNNYSFFEKADGGTYTQVGTTVTNSTVLNSYSLPIQIGDGFRMNYIGIGCKILRARFYSNATETNLVVDFNPASYNASTSQTAWTSATGEIWTINTGTATTGYKGVLVDRTIVQSDGVDDKILTGNVDLSATDKLSMFTSLKRLSTSVGIVFNVGSNTNRFLNLVNTGVIGIANINGGLTNEYTLPNNTSLFLLTNTLDRSQIALSEQNGYFNNVLQTKIPVSALDTSGNLGNNPISLFARIDTIAPYNGIVNTAILALNVSDTTQRTATYNLIRSLNNNSF